MRIEDIDRPRVVEGSEEALLHDLGWLGLDFDGPILRQSEREEAYEAALLRLDRLGRTYPCTCSRREIREASAPHGDEEPRYPGTCRYGATRPERRASIRLRTEPEDRVPHQDRRLGPLDQDVHAEVGDFVLRRSDRLWAYQLAVVVDDLHQGVTCVVRGEDLARSTPRQLLLRKLLDPEAPVLESLHVPMMRGPDGRRLAKRSGSASVAALARSGVSPKEVVGQLARGLGLPAEPTWPEDLVPAWAALSVQTEGR